MPIEPAVEHQFDTVHRILVFTDSMQRIPAWAMLLMFGVIGLFVRAMWPDNTVALLFVIAAEANALGLLLLRYTDRSRGPDRATALALALVMGVPIGLFGLLGLPTWVALVWLTGLTIVAIYSTWVEPFALEVTRQSKSVAGWDAAHPLKLLHLSDLHVEHFGPRERLLNKLIAEARPDVIVFSGDFINISNVGDAETQAIISRIVAGWRAPLGVFAVSGTSPEVDLPDDVPMYLSESENAQSVIGRWATVEAAGGTLHIGGIPTWHRMETDRAALDALLANKPAGGSHLLLIHTPDLAPEAIGAGIDLYLCGHTHAGQICLPGGFPLMTASHLGRKFAAGRVDSGATTVYTSRGIGLEGLGAPRARLFCKPEITLWEINV